MCIAVVGKVVSNRNGRGIVDIRGNQIEVDLRLTDAEAGDSVLVHAGCAIETLREQDAKEISELLCEVEAFARG